MPPLFLLLSAILIIAQLILPKRYAFIPLFIAIFHLGNFSVLSEFTPVRCIFVVGIIRAIASGHFAFSPSENKVDLLVLLFGIWAILTAPFHTESLYNPYTERFGLALNVVGSYLYGRAYLTGPDLIARIAKPLAIIIIPFAIGMSIEASTGENVYRALGARSEFAGVRGDEFRAKGPFGHAIIAGTTGACLLPLMVYLRRRSKVLATAGVCAATIITFSTASSGPMAAYAVSIFLLVYWRWRNLLPLTKKLIIVGLICMHFIMQRGVWFLIARIDLAGGSTGWHRAALIDSAIRYFDEWWLFGTDYTRHWMHSGVSFNPNHTDITNYYLQMGVYGGFPLMLMFILMIYLSIRRIEVKMETMREEGDPEEFGLWCFWIAILTQCVSFISIAYFDQTYALFFAFLGAVPALQALSSIDGDSPAQQGGAESEPMKSVRSL